MWHGIADSTKRSVWLCPNMKRDLVTRARIAQVDLAAVLITGVSSGL
jgi:hypothetical protein